MRAQLLALLLLYLPLQAAAGKGMVVAQERLAAAAGAQVLAEGGSAVDAAVATAFALAVTHPIAGNLGGGGFLLYRQADGKSGVWDFREQAPASARPDMFLVKGRYDEALHHDSWKSVGVPGTVAGLHAAWRRQGRLPWARLLRPAIQLAKEGFAVSPTLAASLTEFRPQFQAHAPTLAQFSRQGEPYRAGDLLCQPDLGRTLERLAQQGPRDFYQGKTARMLVAAMKAEGGLIRRRDLQAYRPVHRAALAGSYRGLEVLTVPPPSGGGVALLTMLNILEAQELKRLGRDSAAYTHLVVEAMRRAFAERARHIGDPAFNRDMPIARLISKAHAARLGASIDPEHASVSDPTRFAWGHESEETTHLSVVDGAGNAVSLTYTLEDNYGVKRIVPGAGFLLNNEMGDFNAGPGLTTKEGLIGTAANLARPGKRMLSSMCPAILVKQGRLVLVTGSPGGRTIPNTVLHTILNTVDFGLETQTAVDAPRFHHQWLPDRIDIEAGKWPAPLTEALKIKGHTTFRERTRIGVAQVIVVRPDGSLVGGADVTRWPESAVATAPQ